MEVKMRKRNKLRYLNLPQDLKSLKIPQCEALCREIRNTLIKTVSKNGGHLASNLGVVELTMAIHRVFNSPDDKIVWDVGHQSYTHKILTGRYDRFDTIRTEDGISGFTKPDESEHDAFISGHSSVSISAAFGMAQAMKLSGSDNYAVAVTGDGALTGGEIYEALNNAGKTNTNLIVIVNHNDMSISKNVGALARYLISVRNTRKYLKTKQAVEKVLVKTPVVGKPVAKILKDSKDSVKSKVYRKNYNTTIFEDLGFIYLGPADGHNLAELEEVLKTAKSYHRPVVVHVNTIKGKGYEPAERNPSEFHGISKFDIMTGNPEVSSDDCYSTCFGRELARIGAEDDNICAITAAMKFGTGLQYFADEFKNRFFDVGIAEQHAVTFSAGLAAMGKIPVFAVYSTFLQRAVDQLIHDVSIGKNHVVLGIDRAGVVGEDGETHHGVFDVTLLMPVPNTVVYSPSCYEELKMCMKSAIYDCDGLACVRYPRGKDNTTFSKLRLNTNYDFTENEDSEILLVTYGRIYDEMYRASNLLNNHGIKCDMLKLTKIIPLDNTVFEKTSKYRHIIFWEEGFLTGGVAEHFGHMLAESGYKGKYYTKGITDYVKQASVASILEKLGLDSTSMFEFVRKIAEQTDEN